MKPFKFRISNTRGGQMRPIPNPGFAQWITINAVFYGSNNINLNLKLLDADGDEFYRVHGQADPKIDYLPTEMTVRFPLSYLDEDQEGMNDIIIWGILDKELQKSVV